MYSTWFCYIWRVVVLSFIPSTPKLVNFANFLESRNWEKNMSTPKLVNFPHFLDSRSWQKNMSTPKLVNFPHFWIPGVEKKHVCIYIICIYVHMYITWFCYIWRVVVLSFIPSTPKLVNFLHFWDSRNWEKTCVYKICIYVHYISILRDFAIYVEGSGSKFHSVNTKTSQFCQFFGVQELRKKYVNTKTSQFPQFWIPGVEKKLVYTYIYIIFKCVHMYITWFCYIWRVVVLSFIPSTPKLANFPFFWIPRVEKKHVYIYIYVCICQLFPTISPHFMGSSIANGISFSS